VHAGRELVAGAIETVPPTPSALYGATVELHTAWAQLHRPETRPYCRQAKVAPAEAQPHPVPAEPQLALVLLHVAATQLFELATLLHASATGPLRVTTRVALVLAQPHTATALLNSPTAQLHRELV
jgi:hypothetical protein